jgi:sugar phosphate isomerase/epimerase
MKLKLGFDNYALRSLGWKAGRVLEYAAGQKLDAVLFSDLDVYEDRSDAALRELKRRADDLGLALYAGTLSICPSSALFDAKRGTAAQQLSETIRVARALGSPVARCVLGNVEDRRGPGGIEARIEETVKVLKACRSQALDAGVNIAVENHAGDMQSWELLRLVEAAGPDFVGVTMDAGNATWALEDPRASLDLLGPRAICTGIRDSAVWETPDGAAFEWVAMGEGSVDWRRYFARYAGLCPHTPVILETISGRPFALPFLKDEFWEAYPRVRPREFARFLALARGGRPRPTPPSDLALRPEFQQAELDKSIRYCRETLGIGAKR